MRIVQIVPGLPPWVDGIGDYALKLAQRLRDEQGINTHFLVATPSWNEARTGDAVDGFPASALRERSEAGFRETLASMHTESGAASIPLLAHFSPYSYQLRGCPFWLVDSLERWSTDHRGSVDVAFHELEDHSYKPWKSNFWLAGVQRRLISRVKKIANFSYTNSELSRGKLEERGCGRLDLILNFSTLEEADEYPAFAQRRREIVVFGRPAQRGLTYERASHAVAAVCRKLNVTHIVDIGAPVEGHGAESLEGFPIERCGRLPGEEVVQRMRQAVASFIHYPVPMLTKSSVYAVSCAQGTMPYVFEWGKQERSCPGLVTGEDFIPVPHSLEIPTLMEPEAASRALFGRYQGRSSHFAAQEIAKRLRVRHGTEGVE